MNETLKFLLAVSCGIPGLAGLSIIRKIDKRFRPLVYLLLLALATELAQRWCIILKVNDAFNNLISNIFAFLNLIMHVWFFYQVGVIKTKQQEIIYILIFITVYFGNALELGSVFTVYEVAIIASFIIILKLCIDGIAIQTFDQHHAWFSDSLFLFCAINILYSAYLIFAFSLRFFGVPTDTDINMAIASMYNYINAGCYLLTLWVILCIPKKKYIVSSF